MEGEGVCYVVMLYLFVGIVGGDVFDIDIEFGVDVYVVLIIFGVIKWYKLFGCMVM